MITLPDSGYGSVGTITLSCGKCGQCGEKDVPVLEIQFNDEYGNGVCFKCLIRELAGDKWLMNHSFNSICDCEMCKKIHKLLNT